MKWICLDCFYGDDIISFNGKLIAKAGERVNKSERTSSGVQFMCDFQHRRFINRILHIVESTTFSPQPDGITYREYCGNTATVLFILYEYVISM